ncbi:M24 family metallopeptidase [Corynebacterium freiburgense]|uniref:M24 family metallopeptidase n=1 Tax=Corynebacterium freiburgense TaxID=556548 RepID=UPI00047C7D71|nr:Xaa-Pro peptidase family protein [Corynebacterium freiburgense]
MSSLFPIHVYADRLTRAANAAQMAGLDGLIFGTGAELAYLTGSWISTHERLTALIIPTVGKPTLVLPAVDRGDLALSAIPELDIEVRGWVDGERPHELAIAALGSLSDAPTIGIGASLTADHVLPLQALLGGSTVLAGGVLKELFMRKDAAEISALREAGAAIDRVHSMVPELLLVGRTEAQVAQELERLILQEHSKVDFIIVGSGPNGANPHHSFSERVLELGDVVVVDIGGTFGPGYHSDCTRTYIVGGPKQTVNDPDFLYLYQVLEQAQAEAVRAVRPGVTAASIDAVARDIITAAGFGEDFIHRTGHGIGLSLHEEPFIMAGNELVLEPGMAFSVEPGIYLEGRVGARIEDIIIVTDSGCESVNNQPHGLQ